MPTYPHLCCHYHERSTVKYTAPYADRRLFFSISYIDLQFCDFLSWLLRGIVCSALFSARIVQVVYPWCTVSLWVSPIFLKDRQVFALFSPIDIWRAINRVRIIIPLISAVRGATSAWIWQLQAALLLSIRSASTHFKSSILPNSFHKEHFIYPYRP